MSCNLTFVIIARNEEKNILRVIESIRMVAGNSSAILVVDHNSTDGTREVAETAGANEVLFVEGGTISEVRNHGGFAVKTDWMAFIDADCELCSQWLGILEPHFENPGIYGWPVSPPQPPTWVQKAWHAHWMQKIKNQKSEVGSQLVRRSLGEGGKSEDQEQRTKNKEQGESAFRLITSANMIIHKTVFESLGGFDPELASGEDQNFMLRAMKQGIQIKALPGLDVIHHGEPRTLRDFYRQQLWHANRGSYSRIMKETGLKQGGNAPLFTVLYVITFLLALLGVLLGIFLHCGFFILSFPWFGLVFLPALRTALRANNLRLVPALGILYASYGLARSLDLLGLNSVKRTWRS